MFVYTAAPRPPHHKQFYGAAPEPPSERKQSMDSGSPLPQKERYTATQNKTKMVAMRFTESDYNSIKRRSEKANMNFTEFVTKAAIGKPIVVIDDLGAVLKEQKAIGRNINQLTTLCNMGKIICPDLQKIKGQYAAVLTALNEIVRRCG